MDERLRDFAPGGHAARTPAAEPHRRGLGPARPMRTADALLGLERVRAHVTWFFEALVLERSGERYTPFDPRFPAIFNSYYRSLGDPYPRSRRGLLSRPTVDEVRAYRRHVDAAMAKLLGDGPDAAFEALAPVLTIGLHHEQQHQELLVMDVKHVLAQNPLRPAYRPAPCRRAAAATPLEWRAFSGGEVQIGAGPEGFAYDNERPRHTILLAPFELASRPVTVGEYRAFMDDGGYQRPELWLADGWDLVQREGWRAPLYWQHDGSDWSVTTLAGPRIPDPAEPVAHFSYYEADAYATWAGAWRHPVRAEAAGDGDGALAGCDSLLAQRLARMALEAPAIQPAPVCIGTQAGSPDRGED